MATETVSRTSTAAAYPEIALDIAREFHNQLHAIACVLEQRLGKSCGDGEEGDPPDDAPLTEWRLSQVMRDMLGDIRIERSIEEALGLRTSTQEAAHV